MTYLLLILLYWIECGVMTEVVFLYRWGFPGWNWRLVFHPLFVLLWPVSWWIEWEENSK